MEQRGMEQMVNGTQSLGAMTREHIRAQLELPSGGCNIILESKQNTSEAKIIYSLPNLRFITPTCCRLTPLNFACTMGLIYA